MIRPEHCRVGTRVRVVAVEAPECRSGAIIEHKPSQGGCLVRHDRAAEFDFGGDRIVSVSTFGWCYHELELEDVGTLPN